MELKYEPIYSTEAVGDLCYGIKIQIAAPTAVSEDIRLAGYKAGRELEQAITREFYKNDEKSQERAREERSRLLGLFSNPIYVEDIPNGYCSRACCEHLPWFVVTTPIGRIKIGWRKRVINIDWSETSAPKADVLFVEEAKQVTTGERLIHAWSYEDAKEYLERILRSGAAK